jgi:IS5 family transposase|nr:MULTISPECIES: IS5 family transposase [Gammaproteobacteria]|tara:strand:- start:92087 stop:93397 length:1311 start_codon:yes stop_codon:yes gene_type:complete
MSFMAPSLLDQLNPKHPLLQLAKTIPWSYFEEEFSPLYSTKGRPAKPIRLMVGLCILKHLEDKSDESLIRHWVQNPYWQAFCGEVEFQWQFPCDPTDLIYFRKRIGEEGFNKILAVSIVIHGESAREEEVCIDTTVQEKNITFPTDAKLYRKIIVRCKKIAKRSGIKQRRSYAKEIKQHKLACRFSGHPRNRAKARKAVKRLKTIAGCLLRELQRKLPADILQNFAEEFALFDKGLCQKRGDKNKLYSLHEPHVYCMSKGKEHKRYEFGTKVSIAATRDSKIIVGAMAFDKNKYDGHTLPKVLLQVEKLCGQAPKYGLCDRGYKGRKKFHNTRILIPGVNARNADKSHTELMRKRFRKRAGIEPVIGHLKSDHRLNRNRLKGFIGDQINVLMAAAAFNFRKWMRLLFLAIKFGSWDRILELWIDRNVGSLSLVTAR